MEKRKLLLIIAIRAGNIFFLIQMMRDYLDDKPTQNRKHIKNSTNPEEWTVSQQTK